MKIVIEFETEEDLEAFCEHLDEREDLNYMSYQVIDDEDAIGFIYDVARNQKGGSECEADYVRVELFKEKDTAGYPARKFRVTVEVSSISGAGTEIMRMAGNLPQVGNFVDGWFDPETKKFTAK